MRTILFIIFLFPINTFAQNAEEHVRMGTDGGDYHLFVENPAISDPKKFGFSFMQVQRKRKYSVVYDWGDRKPTMTYSISETHNAAAILSPIGGGLALGLDFQQAGEDHTGDFDIALRETEETFRSQFLRGRLLISVNNRIRAGVAVRYKTIENDIAGNAFGGFDENVSYEGTLTGFAAGIYYFDRPLGFGISYAPSMRGKADFEGEEIIVAEPGHMNIDWFYGKQNDYKFGFAYKRWIYKSDDRDEPTQIEEDGGNVFLNGVNIEQFLKPTQSFTGGIDTPDLATNTSLRFSVTQQEYVFHMVPDSIPGDDQDEETKFKVYEARAAVLLEPGTFNIQVGYSYEQRKVSTFDDTEGWIAGDFEDYEATDTSLFAMFNYRY